MDTVFTRLQEVELFVCLNVLIIFSKALEEYKSKLYNALQRLFSAGLKLKIGKSLETFERR